MTIELLEAKRIPGMPDKALIKAASMAETNCRIFWSLNADSQKTTQLFFPDSERQITATNNTLLVTELIDRNEFLETTIESLQERIQELELLREL